MVSDKPSRSLCHLQLRILAVDGCGDVIHREVQLNVIQENLGLHSFPFYFGKCPEVHKRLS